MPRHKGFLTNPATVASVYVAFSLLWIVVSDLALDRASLSHTVETAISIAKGCTFVVSSALLIFYLLRRAQTDRERFRSLLESAPDAVVIVDSDGKIALVNAQTERLFGYMRVELIGQPVECLIPERFRHQHPNHRQAMLAAGRSRPMHAGVDLFGRRKDGSEFPADISVSPIRTDEGLVVCSAIRDITDQRQAEGRIKELNLQLEEALRRSDKLASAGRLLATVAHEINNPLDALRNLLYVIKSETGNLPTTKEFVEAAESEVEQLVTITRQTLAPHREPKLPVVTKLPTLLDEVIALFDSKLKRAKISVHREYQVDREVLVSPGDMRQVFTNMISNAIDAMPSGGELRLMIGRSPNSEIVVRIGDTGCGIPPENVVKLFQAFFTTKGERGTGIGLWVSKGIIEKMGGRIDVASSTTGVTGTCFNIYLPEAKIAARSA